MHISNWEARKATRDNAQAPWASGYIATPTIFASNSFPLSFSYLNVTYLYLSLYTKKPSQLPISAYVF
jgi:hypothetical protein